MDLIGWLVSILAGALVFGALGLLWHALSGARAEMRSLGRLDDRRGDG